MVHLHIPHVKIPGFSKSDEFRLYSVAILSVMVVFLFDPHTNYPLVCLLIGMAGFAALFLSWFNTGKRIIIDVIYLCIVIVAAALSLWAALTKWDLYAIHCSIMEQIRLLITYGIVEGVCLIAGLRALLKTWNEKKQLASVREYQPRAVVGGRRHASRARDKYLKSGGRDRV